MTTRLERIADSAGVFGAIFAALCCLGVPFIVALVSGIALVVGVIFVHGFPARELIYAGSAGLIVATIWNISARVRCERRQQQRELM